MPSPADEHSRSCCSLKAESSSGDGWIVTSGLVTVSVVLALWLAVGESKEDRTHRAMAELQTLSIAIESYSIENSVYPAAGGGEVERIRALLEPTWIVDFPTKDPWGRPYLYDVYAFGQRYRLTSTGCDRKLDPPRPTHLIWGGNYAVFDTGAWVRVPEWVSGAS